MSDTFVSMLGWRQRLAGWSTTATTPAAPAGVGATVLGGSASLVSRAIERRFGAEDPSATDPPADPRAAAVAARSEPAADPAASAPAGTLLFGAARALISVEPPASSDDQLLVYSFEDFQTWGSIGGSLGVGAGTVDIPMTPGTPIEFGVFDPQGRLLRSGRQLANPDREMRARLLPTDDGGLAIGFEALGRRSGADFADARLLVYGLVQGTGRAAPQSASQGLASEPRAPPTASSFDRDLARREVATATLQARADRNRVLLGGLYGMTSNVAPLAALPTGR